MSLDRKAATRYLLGRRTASGGYCFYRTPAWGVDEPNAPDTLAAVESLRLLGCVPPDPRGTVSWLRGLQGEDGGFPTLRIGWAALRSLHVLGMEPVRSPADWLAGWLARILDGPAVREWRAALCGCLEVLELLSIAGARLGPAQQRALGRLVAAGRMPGDGWTRTGVDLESTAVAVRVLELARLPIEAIAAVRRLVRDCEDPVLGLRVAPDAGATSAAALDAGLTLARVCGIRPRYPGAIAASILLLQRRDGGLGARHQAISTLKDTWLGLRAEQQLHDLEETRA